MQHLKLLNEPNVDIGNQTGAAAGIRQQVRAAMGANFWAVFGFCLMGLVCSIYVPPFYLHFDQMAGLILQGPLG